MVNPQAKKPTNENSLLQTARLPVVLDPLKTARLPVDPHLVTARLPVVDHSVVTAMPLPPTGASTPAHGHNSPHSMTSISHAVPTTTTANVTTEKTAAVETNEEQKNSEKEVHVEHKEEKKKKKTVDEQNVLIRCIAEFLAVVLFVFVCVLQSQSATIGDSVIHSSLAHGLAITFLATALGGLSGGHVNPAVTCGVALIGKMPPIPATCYVISQLAGSLVGAFLTKAVFTRSTLENIGATLVAPPYQWYSALIAEAIGTMFLVLVVMMTAYDTKKNVLAPLAIGLTLTVNMMAIAKISGGAMNPARSFGPNVIGTIFIEPAKLPKNFWIWHAIYYGGPLIGALTAAGAYRLCFARKKRVVH